jgi:hypothetical protein
MDAADQEGEVFAKSAEAAEIGSVLTGIILSGKAD